MRSDKPPIFWNLLVAILYTTCTSDIRENPILRFSDWAPVSMQLVDLASACRRPTCNLRYPTDLFLCRFRDKETRAVFVFLAAKELESEEGKRINAGSVCKSEWQPASLKSKESDENLFVAAFDSATIGYILINLLGHERRLGPLCISMDTHPNLYRESSRNLTLALAPVFEVKIGDGRVLGRVHKPSACVRRLRTSALSARVLARIALNAVPNECQSRASLECTEPHKHGTRCKIDRNGFTAKAARIAFQQSILNRLEVPR